MNKKYQDIKIINNLFKTKTSEEIINISINKIFKSKITYVCSFGIESAVILHMISKINNKFPIIFININKLFVETIKYKNDLLKLFNLENFSEIFPYQDDIKKFDPHDSLWKDDPDKCCNIRKVIPLKKKLSKYDAWFSGRKSYHNADRSEKKFIEFDEKYLISPLIDWDYKKINDYFLRFKIPRHPLFSLGYFSVGCQNCTIKSKDKKNMRSGRWANLNKTECGIHSVKWDKVGSS